MASTNSTGGSAEIPLILAAIELFGRDGYAAVSTRTLCEQAGTNISSIKYHFGGKEELYRAAIFYVVNQLRPRIEVVASAFEQGREMVGTNPVMQAKLIKQLVKNLLHFFLGSKDIPYFMPFVMRELLVPGKYFSDLYEGIPRHLHELITRIVAMVQDVDAEDETSIIRAHSLLGQIMIFHIARPFLFKRLDWQEFTPARIELITQETQLLVLRALQLEDTDD